MQPGVAAGKKRFQVKAIPTQTNTYMYIFVGIFWSAYRVSAIGTQTLFIATLSRVQALNTVAAKDNKLRSYAQVKG